MLAVGLGAEQFFLKMSEKRRFDARVVVVTGMVIVSAILLWSRKYWLCFIL